MMGRTQLVLAEHAEKHLDDGMISLSQKLFYEAIESFMIADGMDRFSRSSLRRAYGDKTISEANKVKFTEWSEVWNFIVKRAGVDNDLLDAAYTNSSVRVDLIKKKFKCVKDGHVFQKDAGSTLFQGSKQASKKRKRDEKDMQGSGHKKVALETTGHEEHYSSKQAKV